MSHTFVQALMHVVFSTKQRRKLIPKDRLAATWAYMAGVCKSNKIFVHEIGGMADHAHLLVQIPPLSLWRMPFWRSRRVRRNGWERVLSGNEATELSASVARIWQP